MKRSPIAALEPFVALVWATEDDLATRRYTEPRREHLLPSGLMHLVIRLADDPLHLLGPDDETGVRAPDALVGGARLRYHVRETVASSSSVGAVLRPGTAPLLFGETADALAHRHTALHDLWGSSVSSLRARLRETRGAAARLVVFEAHLCSRLPVGVGAPPRIQHLVQLAHAADDVRDAVRLSGLGHRRFIAEFRHHLGLAPKAYLRVRRFRYAVRLLRAQPTASLADVAAMAGYADQSHLGRDFVEIAGVAPGEYRRAAPIESSHLPRPGPTARAVDFLLSARVDERQTPVRPPASRGPE